MTRGLVFLLKKLAFCITFSPNITRDLTEEIVEIAFLNISSASINNLEIFTSSHSLSLSLNLFC